MKKNQTQIKKYAAVISIFLAAVIVGLFVFFFCIKRSVEQRSKNTMRNNVVRQSEHLRTILDIQYDYLNGLTEEIGKTDHLLAKKNMDLIKSITKHTDFCGTALIEPNGDAHYDNGLIKNLSHRRYFKEVISGKRTLSDPLDSSISGSTRVVLGVPIYNSKHKVIGALGGSYDVTALSRMLFEDLFNGQGCSMIIAQNGEIIAFEGDILGRIGGDEFGVIMKNIQTKDIAMKKAEELLAKTQAYKIDELKGNNISISIGISTAPQDGDCYMDLYKRADQALYQAKRSGKARVCNYFS